LTRTEFDPLQDLMRAAGAGRTSSELVRVARGDFYGYDAYVSEAD
jgi:hypothetical protein